LDTSTPSLSIRRVSLTALHNDPANARTHDQRNLGAITASLQRFGQAEPLVVHKATGRVIGGNGRLVAMLALGWTECDVVEVDVDEMTATALGIALNRTAELADWDLATLGELLGTLRTEDALAGVGFDDDEIDELLAELGLQDGAGEGEEGIADDPVPELPEVPVSRLGDLWILGEHRVLCGDATNPTDVSRLLAGATPRLMVSDPPYGVSYDPNWRNEAGVSSTKRTGAVTNDDRVDWREAWELFPGDVAYIWHAGKYCGPVAASLEAAKFEIRAQLIWAKSRFALSRGAYHWQHEPAYFCVRKGSKAHWIGDRKQSTVWQIASTNDGDATIHGTQKPVECMARPMRNHDAPEVYDCFLGSGSSLAAAEHLGRRCYGLEIDPRYVDVTIERWEKLSGKQAVQAGSNTPFAKIRSERLRQSEGATS
jgi:DNA modification methylase